jgi:flagellar motor switch protein FliM
VIQICEHDTVMFSLTMEATVRGAVGRITICVPLFMIENAIRQMQVKPDHEAQQRAKAMPSWRDGYELIPVVGLAEINIGSMSVSEVMNWQVGSVVSLPDGIMEAVTLRLAELPFFSCEAGIENEHRAVKIRE